MMHHDKKNFDRRPRRSSSFYAVIILPVPTSPPVTTSITQHLSRQPCSVPYLDLPSTHQSMSKTYPNYLNKPESRSPIALQISSSSSEKEPRPLYIAKWLT